MKIVDLRVYNEYKNLEKNIRSYFSKCQNKNIVVV